MLPAVFVAAAVLGGLLAYWLTPGELDEFDQGDVRRLAACLVAFVIGTIGYVVAPSAAGQLLLAVSTWYGYVAALIVLDVDGDSAVLAGLILLPIGLVWLVLAERRVWREQQLGRTVGVFLAVFASQVPTLSGADGPGWLLTVLVGAVAMVMFAARGSRPYLLGCALAAVLAMPQAVAGLADEDLPVPADLLVALLALASAVLGALRLREGRDRTRG